MLDLADRYHLMPEEMKLANFAVQEKVAALVRAEIAVAQAFGKPEYPALASALESVKKAEVSEKEKLRDIQRKMLEYEDAKAEYKLQTKFLREMQEAYLRHAAQLKMLHIPLYIHEVGEVAALRERPEYSELWSNVFANVGPGFW